MSTRSVFKTCALATMVVSVLSGCAATREVKKMEQDSWSQIRDRAQAAGNVQMKPSTFSVDNSFYAARTPLATTPVNPTVKLPDSFYKNANMNQQTPTSLTEIASKIARSSGYEVRIDQDVLSGNGQNRQAQAATAAPATTPSADTSAPPTGLPPLPSAAVSFAPTPISGGNDLVLNDVLFSGNLVGLLDTVTGRLNLSWRWTGSKIEIFRYETKMFRLNALAGEAKVEANLDATSESLSSSSSGSSGGGGGSQNAGVKGSSGQSTSVSSTMEIWKEVEDSIKGILSEKGKMVVVPSSGTLTVRDTPEALRQVEAQVQEFNRIYNRQVRVNVEVYAVERRKEDNMAIDWNLVWQTAGSRFGLDVAQQGGAAGGSNTFTLNMNRGPWSGSSVVANVLNTVGKTTLLTRIPVTTLNGRTAPVNVSRDQAYVAEYSTTTSTNNNTGNTTTITPGVVSEGISMNVTPRVLEDNNVLVRYAIDLSTIEGITTFTSPDGNSAIQLPQRAVRNFLQDVRIKSGETMVLTGFEQANGQDTTSGPLSPKAWWAGGSKQAVASSRTLVIVITPYVLQ